MKKVVLLICLTLLSVKFIYSQNTFPPTGSVGIGTTSPGSSLEIQNLVDQYQLRLGAGSWYYDIGRVQAGGYLSIQGNQVGFNNIVLAPTSGNVGIGTFAPNAKLDVYTDIAVPGTYNTQYWSTSNPGYDLRLQTIWDGRGINYNFIQNFNGIDYTSLSFFQGKVGIGTTTPDYKLDVIGRIRAWGVKINTTKSADFVFDTDYKLRTLSEVEAFIKAHKHLPDIQSATQMKKDGLEMGDFQINLLQKIEELTIYSIQLKKENEAQAIVNKDLQQQVLEMKRDMEEIKKLMAK